MIGRALALAALLTALHPAPVQARSTPAASVEQRLVRAEDELAIKRILIGYHWALDHRDFAAYAGLFAKQGEWINGSLVRKGPAEILKMLTDIYGPTPADYVNRDSLHLTTNLEVIVTGDRASARSRHLLLKRGPGGSIVPTLAGRYEDSLIREDGQWKILRRTDYPVIPTAEEWGEVMRKRRAAQ